MHKFKLRLLDFEQSDFVIVYAEAARELGGDFGDNFRRQSGLALIGELVEWQSRRSQRRFSSDAAQIYRVVRQKSSRAGC
jgi:hypothetical protein